MALSPVWSPPHGVRHHKAKEEAATRHPEGTPVSRRDPRCRCGSHRKRRRCCGRYLDGQAPPAPEDLMRARYTAYAVGDVSFIINTTDPNGPMWEADRERWTQSIIDFRSSFQFTGVDILRADPPDTDRGWHCATWCHLSSAGPCWSRRWRRRRRLMTLGEPCGGGLGSPTRCTTGWGAGTEI